MHQDRVEEFTSQYNVRLGYNKYKKTGIPTGDGDQRLLL